MPKLIEIIGPPGSGKTYICDQLERLKKNNKKIFFHSSNSKYKNAYKKLNSLSRNFIKIKVILNIIVFYLFFYKRFFLKKIYKKNFFFKIIFLIYKHFLSIEYLKKSLPNEKFLITEPGPIMYFLQDYFYINKKLTNSEIKNFNNFFLKTDFLIFVKCNANLAYKRIHFRKRGLPTRMRSLNNKEIKKTILKSVKDIEHYIKNSKKIKNKIIKINTGRNPKIDILKKIFLTPQKRKKYNI